MAKSNNKKQIAANELQQTHPMAARKTLFVLENKEGEIVSLDPVSFAIRTKGDGKIILPLNLPENFSKAGLKIRFSAMAKETDPSELWAAQPVLLTKAEKIS